MKHRKLPKPFRSAKTEVKRLEKEKIKMPSNAFELAFTDRDFLLREELRPIRLMLELHKAEVMQHEQHIHSTIFVLGSARLLEPKAAKSKLAGVKRLLKENPDNRFVKESVKTAENLVELSKYYDEARKFSMLISSLPKIDERLDFVIVTGGGPGIMEAANRGAHDVNAKSIGLNIVLPMEQAPNPYITPELCFQFHYFAMRKMHFLIRARALVVFPGGFGTLDELFEALTLLQTKKIEKMPVLLFGQDYWTKVMDLQTLVDYGMISPEDLNLFQYVEKAEEACDIIKHFYEIDA